MMFQNAINAAQNLNGRPIASRFSCMFVFVAMLAVHYGRGETQRHRVA